MKKTAFLIATALSGLLLNATSQAVEVMSLRGSTDLQDESSKPIKAKVMNVQGGIMRSYKQQPPMVPHEVDKYIINIKNNGCLKCHSEETYQKEKAPKVGDSHYVTRDGEVLKTISSRRYFCNQCHAPQVGAAPLVQNNFVGSMP